NSLPRVGRLCDWRDPARGWRRARRPLVKPEREPADHGEAKRSGEQSMTLQSLLGIELPIIQAPMAGIQGSALAVAVSNAGGLGSLPCALLSPAALRTELAAIRAQTVKPFNVNFFCHTPPYPSAEREASWRATL